MNRSLLRGLFVLVGSLVLTASAHAVTANFGGKCSFDSTNTHLNCFFDGVRGSNTGLPGSSCNNSFDSPQYYFDYGDFNDSGNFSYNNFYSHQYALPIASNINGSPYGFYVNLVVQCPEGQAQKTRYLCVYGFGVAGCIPPNGTWQ